MFAKILVANRGEIAVRAFRAATELGARTVAVFPHEDRRSEHRLKADESYQIGEEGHPVRAYLDHENIVRVAVECGADAIYPGYGFLSENPLLAEACEANGITFIGPPASALHLAGNKSRAITAARAAGLPTLESAEPTDRPRHPGRGGRGHRLPGVRQGGLRRRWARHAAGRRPLDAARVARGGPARGRCRVRRPDALPRAGGGQPAAHRGAGARRLHRHRAAPLRARLLGAAPPPEGRRDRAGAQPRPRPPGRRCVPMPCASPSRSATSTRARSSSSSARTGATSSSR